MIIGILAIQGARVEHARMLKKLDAETLYVRTLQDLERVDALIIPGGESTTIGKLIDKNGLAEKIKSRIQKGMPVYGTCAGAILLAKKITSAKKANNLDLMDIEISRNAYGSQLDSFVADIEISELGEEPFESVFIRAPKVEGFGKNVELIALHGGDPVMLKEGNILISTFHPELSSDTRVHEYFLKMVHAAK